MKVILNQYLKQESSTYTVTFCYLAYIKKRIEKSRYEIFIMQAEIQLPILEITGIACSNFQIVTASPARWTTGNLHIKYHFFTKNTRKTIPILRYSS